MVCGMTRNFLQLLADRILNFTRLELLADKAFACSCGTTSRATSCACIIFGVYCSIIKLLNNYSSESIAHEAEGRMGY